MKEAEVDANSNNYATIYPVKKAFAVGHKSFDGCVRNVDGRLLIHGKE